eukprot:TRINITY_DN4043_c0_g1_i3.p2 TRINITY_DN4043_c0_g1~~TRINITY_DN4043_c0_g1_i3.p2  ORF type:complete len:119 (-),score=3.52 TRINITY_DN4043_c0_g1_i3:322-678(-)
MWYIGELQCNKRLLRPKVLVVVMYHFANKNVVLNEQLQAQLVNIKKKKKKKKKLSSGESFWVNNVIYVVYLRDSTIHIVKVKVSFGNCIFNCLRYIQFCFVLFHYFFPFSIFFFYQKC